MIFGANHVSLWVFKSEHSSLIHAVHTLIWFGFESYIAYHINYSGQHHLQDLFAFVFLLSHFWSLQLIHVSICIFLCLHFWALLYKITRTRSCYYYKVIISNHTWIFNNCFLNILCKFHVTQPKKSKKEKKTIWIYNAFFYYLLQPISLFLGRTYILLRREIGASGAEHLPWMTSSPQWNHLGSAPRTQEELFLLFSRFYFSISGMHLISS